MLGSAHTHAKLTDSDAEHQLSVTVVTKANSVSVDSQQSQPITGLLADSLLNPEGLMAQRNLILPGSKMTNNTIF